MPSTGDKLPLPAYHGAGPSSPATPSRRRLISLTLASLAVFAIYSFTSGPSTRMKQGSSGAARMNGPKDQVAEGTTPAPANADFAWPSWRPWSSSSPVANSVTAPGRHDIHASPLSSGLATAVDQSQWESPTRPLPLAATLDERLKSWEAAPLPEPADWVSFSLQTCPESRVGKNGNYDLLKKAHLLWSTINSTHVREKRRSLINYLRDAEDEGRLSPSHWGRGRGLVFTAGNADTYVRVLLTLRMVRNHLKLDLPAEIFSFPGEEPDEVTRAALTEVNATLKVVPGWTKDSKRTKNYHIKASALVHCSFREPLYLDSDNLPAVLEAGAFDSLWDSKAYKKLGMFFWPDYWKTHADIPIWLLIGTQCRDEWEQEAGQILIDKGRHLDVLLLSEFMLRDWQYWFNMSDGDKDIFRFAALALRKRWALPGRYLGAGGLSWNTVTGYCGHTMLQHDATGRPMFVHMNLLKQIPSGISRGTTFKRTRSVKLVTDPSEKDERREDLIDWAVEADMLANANIDGTAILPAPEVVRRRAALERGLRPFLHGGSVSAVCADIAWDDPRTDEDVEADAIRYFASHPGKDGNGKEEVLPDLRYTEAEDGMRVRWDDPVETLQWHDDPRLRDFEDRFFDMGGRTTGQGF